MDDIKGQVVLITGSSRGIGLGFADAFINVGAKVIITGTSQERLKEAEKSLKGKNEASYCFDVSKSQEVDLTFNKILEKFSTIDVLVNNAGITNDTLMLRMSEEQWDQVLNINLKGAFLCSKAVLRVMMKARSGKIINISSVVGLMGNAGQVNYSSSKAGLLGMTKSMAKELASRHICVNAIAPGFIESDMTETLNEKAKESFLNHIPLQRAGQVSDVAQLCLFLASSASNYITGQVINVDGGLVM